ncbi:MAG: hypothetical protein FWD83_06575 [Promicromonosporaceae bacterium]|nr:hypothetical protein [Promicromonosporaceae bacterium]
MTTLTAPKTTCTAQTAALDATDRCDRCGAQAYVRVGLTAGELLFCGHHSKQFANSYEKKATFIQDETARFQAQFATFGG